MVRKTIYGKASAQYRVDGALTMNVVVPFGVKGKVILPDYVTDIKIGCKPVEKGESIILDGGEHLITGRIN